MKIEPDRPYSESLAFATASASSSNGITATTGPNTSSRQIRVRRVVDGHHAGRDPPAGAVGLRAGERDLDLVEVALHATPAAPEDTSGPISEDSSDGSSTRSAVHRLLEAGQELVVRRPLDQDPRPRAAVLAGVVEDGVRRRGGRRGDVGVGEDDVGALAAELEGHRLDLVGAAGHDPLADLGRAGEDDLADQLVGHEPLADHRPLARQHRQHVLGQPGLERQLADPDRGQRRDLGGLEHDGVAGGQRGREAPAGDRHREVPRHDHAHHARAARRR